MIRYGPCRQVDGVGVGGDEPGAEALGLLAEPRHQLGAHDAVGEAGVVLDVGGEHELAAGGEALDDERREVRARGVDGRGQTGGAGADDDDLVVLRHWYLRYDGSSRTSRRDEDSAEDHPRRPDRHGVGQDAEQHDRSRRSAVNTQHAGEDAVDDVVRGAGGGFDGAVPYRDDRLLDGVGRLAWSSGSSIVLVLLRPVGSGGGGYPARRPTPGPSRGGSAPRGVEHLGGSPSAATTNTIVRWSVSMPRTTAGGPRRCPTRKRIAPSPA